ncbi:MAG: adenylate kinase [Endomicrobiia bacterium]
MKTKKTLFKRIIFLGPPGSGKGTQATVISKKFGLPHISTGEIFRKILKSNTKLSKKIKEYVTKGKLVPDTIVFSAIESVIKKGTSFLLDGFPRNLAQAKMLEKKLNINNSIEKVFYFNISDKEVIKRLTSRRTCPSCGRNYNIISMKPKKDNLCDKCNTKLITRDDDKLDTVKKRLKVYKKDTKPLINFYKKKNLLVEINANKPVDEITKQIVYVFKTK